LQKIHLKAKIMAGLFLAFVIVVALVNMMEGYVDNYLNKNEYE
jgi:hypothetical protein